MKILVNGNIIDLSLVYKIEEGKNYINLKVINNSDTLTFRQKSIHKEDIPEEYLQLYARVERRAGNDKIVSHTIPTEVTLNMNDYYTLLDGLVVRFIPHTVMQKLEDEENARFTEFKKSIKKFYLKTQGEDIPTLNYNE